MALANWPAFPGQQRNLRRMRQVLSWASARSPERGRADLVPLGESHPWVHGEVGQVLKRRRIEAAAGAQLPDPEADVVEPDPLGEVFLIKQLGVTGPEPGE